MGGEPEACLGEVSSRPPALIVSLVCSHMLVVGGGFEQTNNMVVRLGIKPIQEHRIDCIELIGQLDFRVVDRNRSVAVETQFTSNLQRNPHCCLLVFHSTTKEQLAYHAADRGLCAEKDPA